MFWKLVFAMQRLLSQMFQWQGLSTHIGWLIFCGVGNVFRTVAILLIWDYPTELVSFGRSKRSSCSSPTKRNPSSKILQNDHRFKAILWTTMLTWVLLISILYVFLVKSSLFEVLYSDIFPHASNKFQFLVGVCGTRTHRKKFCFIVPLESTQFKFA